MISNLLTKCKSSIINLLLSPQARLFHLRFHISRILSPRLIFSPRVPYICLALPLRISFPLNSQRALSTPGPRCTTRYRETHIQTHSRTKGRCLRPARIAAFPPSSPSPSFLRLAPLPFFRFHSRRLRQTASSGNIREHVLLHSFSRLPSPLPSLIARKYTVEEQFGPAVESVLWV